MKKEVIVIGGGLAGVEASYYLAEKGIKVKLYEMRPHVDAKAHHTDLLAELVCSNSLKSNRLDSASGLLKEELRLLNSIIMEVADKTAIPSGHALAVDRDSFAQTLTKIIKTHPNIEIINQEVTTIDINQPTIIASGPLTSIKLSNAIKELLGEEYLYFYDAAAPLIESSSINKGICYEKSRYDKGEGGYLNCPFTVDQFELFYQELINAKRATLKEFEKEIHFEACMPIESMAQRGAKTLLFGPLKPVGLEKEKGKRPYAVVQLRQDDLKAELYNIVGFQTNLTFKEQERVFRLIPGLENASFARYGVMHRNTFINAPTHLNSFLQCKVFPNIFFAGQITGVEGYIESSAMGLVSAMYLARILNDQTLNPLPLTTIIGSLAHYVASANPSSFQPMNANFGLLELEKDKMKLVTRALEDLNVWISKQMSI